MVTMRDAETGEQIWKFDYPFQYEDQYGYDNGPRCCPVIHDGRVYTHGVEGVLHALDFKTGEKYLVYASRSSEGGLETGMCDRTDNLRNARKDLKILGKGKITSKSES